MEESPEEVLTRLKQYVAAQSPEDVLTQLERYVASLRDARTVPPVDRAASATVVDAPAASKPEPAVDTFIPSRMEPARHPPRFVSEVAPALLAVSTCAFVIAAFELLAPAIAVVVAAALTLIGVIGLVQRVPLARACIVGLIVAGVLIRFS